MSENIRVHRSELPSACRSAATSFVPSATKVINKEAHSSFIAHDTNVIFTFSTFKIRSNLTNQSNVKGYHFSGYILAVMIGYRQLLQQVAVPAVQFQVNFSSIT